MRDREEQLDERVISVDAQLNYTRALGVCRLRRQWVCRFSGASLGRAPPEQAQAGYFLSFAGKRQNLQFLRDWLLLPVSVRWDCDRASAAAAAVEQQ